MKVYPIDISPSTSRFHHCPGRWRRSAWWTLRSRPCPFLLVHPQRCQTRLEIKISIHYRWFSLNSNENLHLQRSSHCHIWRVKWKMWASGKKWETIEVWMRYPIGNLVKVRYLLEIHSWLSLPQKNGAFQIHLWFVSLVSYIYPPKKTEEVVLAACCFFCQ